MEIKINFAMLPDKSLWDQVNMKHETGCLVIIDYYCDLGSKFLTSNKTYWAERQDYELNSHKDDMDCFSCIKMEMKRYWAYQIL